MSVRAGSESTLDDNWRPSESFYNSFVIECCPSSNSEFITNSTLGPFYKFVIMSDFNASAPGISYFTPEQNPPSGTAVNPQSNGKLIPKLFQPIKIRGVQSQ